MHPGQFCAALPRHLDKQTAAEDPEIAREDCVIVPGRRAAVLQMRKDALHRRRRHGCAHVIGVGNAIVDTAPNRERAYRHATRPLRRKHGRSRARHRVLARRRLGCPQLQRKAELPLRRGEMAARRAQDVAPKPAVQQHARRRQRFGHSGACAIHPEKRDAEIARRIGGRDDLIQQVAAQQQIYLSRGQSRVLNRPFAGTQEKLFFRELKGFFAPLGVLGIQVKVFAERAFGFLLPDRRSLAADIHRVGKHHRSFR